VQLFNDVQQKVSEFASANATTLLTAGGVVGTVATAVLAGRASIKAYQVLEAEKEKVEADPTLPVLTNGRKALLVAPHYIPPVITGAATITAIIMVNRMSAQKAAALAAAYGMSQKHFEEYKAKVEEKLTGPKKTQIDDEIAQDRVNKTKGYENIVVVEGEVLCFDAPTGRYFRATMEKINRAVNATNAEILHHDFASASFFYNELDLPATTWTEEVGWNTDRLLELTISTTMSPDQRPCIEIDFKSLPIVDYVPKHY